MRVVANAATSVDGKLSTRERAQTEISGPADFDRVDELRAESDAVMVGVGTVLADDPSLTVDSADRRERRSSLGLSPNPTRVVADSTCRTPLDARVLDDSAETVLLASDAASSDDVDERTSAGAEVVIAGDDRVDLAAALATLEGDGIETVMVEGGGTLLYSLFEAGLVDELRVYVGSIVIGGSEAPTLVDGPGFVADFPALELRSSERIDDGVLLEYRVADA